MAEVLAAMAVGPLLSLVKEKASNYLLDQYNVMDGMEEQHKLLKRRLSYILDVIADAEMQAAEHKEGAKAWLEEIRGVAYNANDVFDEFKYEALRRKAKKEGHYHELGMHFIKLFPTHNRIVFRYRMGNRLGMILKEIEVLVTEMNDFQLKFQSQQQVSMNWRQTDSNIVGPAEIVKTSRDEEKKKVVDTFLGQGGNKDLTVLPIFGMGGLGKTTLAQLVYNDSKIKKHFQLLLWVCVSDNFDVDFLATSIVKATNAKENKNGSERDERPPLDILREVLSGKRYLLVLDDVWNRDSSKWDKLKSCLQHGGMGSSVLTTTRDKAIAQLMGTVEAYKLSLLGKNFIEEIIKTKAFSSKDESPANERVEMVGDMAKRCAGSPLAATALGSVLRTKHTVGEWKDVLSRSTICDEETGILPTLKLSYNDLSSQMRQCFSFCAMFPKDYEIEVDKMIQLWMANGFILEEQGVCLEIRGKQIFNELASRSFFQDVKEIPFGYDLYPSGFKYCSRITCKIHDLMHDVAQSAMGKECATIASKPSKSEDLPYSTRHLFVATDDPKKISNGFLEERSTPALQTLLCTQHVREEFTYLSKYNSIRALTIISRHLSLKPKYMHHLRYLDLSWNNIKALPEDISILYHLQTLNLSNCGSLTQLPKNMKYMTALRHLYTEGCSGLKMMPPELRCLTSLQTLTCFVAGSPDSSCSNMEELGLLDLGGHLQVRQLENVAETDARAANLGNKKKVTELRLRWRTHPGREPQQQQHHKVLGALKPHEGIKAIRIYGYGGSTFPTWISTLHHTVELVLYDCNMVEKLPPLWQLQDLQVLYMKNMENIRCFCDGDPPFTFNNLKELTLFGMGNLETWWEINELQGEEPIFPEVEKLSILHCGKLTALPRASVITVTSDDGVNTTEWRSPFPALKELELSALASFQSWEAVEGTVGGEQMTTFPWLKKLSIRKCPELTTLPEAPELSELKIFEGGSQEIFVHVARYITSLSELELSIDDRETALPREDSLIELVNNTEKWSRESSLVSVCLSAGCDFLLPRSSSAPALWNCLVQLQDLTIHRCHALVHWPENVFGCLVSLRKLEVVRCNKLTGCMQASDEQSTPGRSVLPPRLESLWLRECESLVEVPVLPASLTQLYISECEKLESVVLRKQQNTSVLAEVPNPSPPIIRDLFIRNCSNLLSLSVQLDCTQLTIERCTRLKSLDDLPSSSLERLIIWDCDSLDSIPDVPQAYTSLRDLTIRKCPSLKVLPPCLKQRLNYIEHPYLDARHIGPKLSRPSTWKYAISRHC